MKKILLICIGTYLIQSSALAGSCNNVSLEIAQVSLATLAPILKLNFSSMESRDGNEAVAHLPRFLARVYSGNPAYVAFMYKGNNETKANILQTLQIILGSRVVSGGPDRGWKNPVSSAPAQKDYNIFAHNKLNMCDQKRRKKISKH